MYSRLGNRGYDPQAQQPTYPERQLYDIANDPTYSHLDQFQQKRAAVLTVGIPPPHRMQEHQLQPQGEGGIGGPQGIPPQASTAMPGQQYPQQGTCM